MSILVVDLVFYLVNAGRFFRRTRGPRLEKRLTTGTHLERTFMNSCTEFLPLDPERGRMSLSKIPMKPRKTDYSHKLHTVLSQTLDENKVVWWTTTPTPPLLNTGKGRRFSVSGGFGCAQFVVYVNTVKFLLQTRRFYSK